MFYRYNKHTYMYSYTLIHIQYAMEYMVYTHRVNEGMDKKKVEHTVHRAEHTGEFIKQRANEPTTTNAQI